MGEVPSTPGSEGVDLATAAAVAEFANAGECSDPSGERHDAEQCVRDRPDEKRDDAMG
jgi:hypothetical protein